MSPDPGFPSPSPSPSLASPGPGHSTSLAARLFGLRVRVPRKMYICWGFALAIVKFALDFAIMKAVFGRTWTPIGYLVPSLVLRQETMGGNGWSDIGYLIFAAVAMPFLWVGLSMSVRRAADAGLSPWFGVGFLVPLYNYVTIAVLCWVPTKASASWNPPPANVYRQASRKESGEGGDDAAPISVAPIDSKIRYGILSVIACMAIGLPMLWLSVYGLRTYGGALFFATPFAMGAASASVLNRVETATLHGTIGFAVLGTLLTGAAILLFGIEGILCLAMAFPLAAILAGIGAIVGRAIVVAARRPKNGGAMLVLLPLFAFGESKVAAPTAREVTTVIEVDAPPEAVWTNVVGFSDLPPPASGSAADFAFRMGIAYPIRARIDGTGIGAVRQCEFSTGPFVEPITVWDEPHRLAFDVTSQPPSMTELSPWKNVHAPHLEGYMVSHGGEFRLIPLPGNRTRLEGTTHYTLDIFPEAYWTPWAEALLHSIHRRVLTHVKRLSEASANVR